MKIFLDCLPCILKQVLDASRMATQDPNLQAEIMEKSIKILLEYKKFRNAPEIAKEMHQVVKRLTGVSDPYKTIKEKDIAAAKKVYPFLRKIMEQNHNGLYWALKIAAIGNILDSAIYGEINIEKCIAKEMAKEFSTCDIDIFGEMLKTAKHVLFLGDNAGETVFDLVLIERLAGFEMTYAVRSEPIINDATMKDAYDSGLNRHAHIMTTGCGAPGAIPDQCSPEFLSVFNKADIVISKGQGNFEALSDCRRPVFFLLKAKCPMIAGRLNVDLNDYVFKYQGDEISDLR